MPAPTGTRSAFAALAEAVLESWYEANPVDARRLGLHAWDGRLPDVSAAGTARRVAELDEWIERLDAIDPDGLDDEARMDWRVLSSHCRFERLKLGAWGTRRRYPLDYLELLDVSDYLKRDYAPRRDRLAALCLHLNGIPRLLDDAADNLADGLDRVVLETSERLLRAYADFLDEDLAELLDGTAGGDTELADSLLQARREAIEATKTFADLLGRRAVDARDDAFPVGPEVFAAMLRHGEGVEVPLDRLLEIAEGELARNRGELEELARRIDPAATPGEIVDRVKRDHPSAGEVVEAVRRVNDDLREFVRSRGLVTIPSDTECRVRETPSYLAWAFAMLEAPGVFEERDFPCHYYVTPPRPDWDDAQTEDWLREFSRGGIRNTTVHEAWPGHFVHDLHLRRCPSRVLRSVYSYSSFEAWAHYCEQMMVEEGYGDDAVRVAQLGDALLRSVRFVVSIRMHTRGMTVDEATDLFRREAWLGGEAARSEAERGTFDPGYANYTLGKLMLLALRNDWEAIRGGRSLREFHDEFLSHGAAPVPFVRERMLPGNADPVL